MQKKHVFKLNDFNLFCNPNNKVFDGYYDCISYHCIEHSSYIHYIVLTYDSFILKPMIITSNEVLDYLNEGYRVIAFNHCDFVCLEVVL